MRDSEWNGGVVGAAGIVFGIMLASSYSACAAGGEIHASDWLQFFGTLLGASATILGGAIAWFAAQKQIFHKEDAARDVINRKLKNYLEPISVAWIAIEKAIEMDTIEYIEIAEQCISGAASYRAEMLIEEIKVISAEASASDRDYISSIIGRHISIKECDARHRLLKERGFNAFARLANLKGIMSIFEHIFFDVRKYSDELADMADGKGGDRNNDYFRMTRQSLEHMWRDIERRRK